MALDLLMKSVIDTYLPTTGAHRQTYSVVVRKRNDIWTIGPKHIFKFSTTLKSASNSTTPQNFLCIFRFLLTKATSLECIWSGSLRPEAIHSPMIDWRSTMQRFSRVGMLFFY